MKKHQVNLHLDSGRVQISRNDEELEKNVDFFIPQADQYGVSLSFKKELVEGETLEIDWKGCVYWFAYENGRLVSVEEVDDE